MIFGFARLGLYTSPQSVGALGADQTQALVALTRHAGSAAYNIGAMCFSIGSILFFYLFFKSRYISRILSAFGVFASVIVTIICFGSLIFPEHAAPLQYGWAPMAIAEVTTGFWLMLFAVKTQARVISNPPDRRSSALSSGSPTLWLLVIGRVAHICRSANGGSSQTRSGGVAPPQVRNFLAASAVPSAKSSQERAHDLDQQKR